MPTPKNLEPPHGVTVNPSPEGAWSVVVQWEYGFRYTEVDRFEIRRQARGADTWKTVATAWNEERSCADLLPDEGEYTYTVAAVPPGGQPLVSPLCTAPEGTPYIRADMTTARPSGLRKPLLSTKQLMVLAWDAHPQAEGYLLQALDGDGELYLSTHIPDPAMSVGLLTGPHPGDEATVRVSVLRRRPDGSLYPASSVQRSVSVDSEGPPRWTAVPFGAMTLGAAGEAATGAVVALSGPGHGTPRIAVDGVLHEEAWEDHGGHKAALVRYMVPAGAGVRVAVAGGAPS